MTFFTAGEQSHGPEGVLSLDLDPFDGCPSFPLFSTGSFFHLDKFMRSNLIRSKTLWKKRMTKPERRKEKKRMQSKADMGSRRRRYGISVDNGNRNFCEEGIA
ncbi:hypothetical protein NLA06_07480 [Desulfomicrobium sp. ZS1]|uniref:hypothetical protein n=1 Tax=Desulfomicrobium sp. ZS1 TaxID=2952228 RepID=UPI0020B28928|nr:hypothetical protein [Desulfomicrobium sp. ZS1]UTF51714.1 hypothetical protein NLA06_07480 [Desulfomicrobium sp. ZS1]